MLHELSPIIATARKQWARCADAEEPQRKAILLAKEFRALKQWPDAIRIAREGGGNLAGQPPQPPRPCLVVDRLSPAVRNISNTIKNADFGFDVMPNGTGADRETADILKGYLRRMQNQSRGESPIEWAADGAAEGGLGWVRMKTEFVHATWDGDPNNPEAYDQELRLHRIPNSLSVYCDPSAMHPSRRDAQFMFVVEDMDRDAFKARFPKADVRGLEEFQSIGDMSSWVTKDIIRVAEYWRVEYATKKIASTDGRFSRTIRTPTVKGSLISAVQELETFACVGRRIPLFPVFGEELNVDGKTILRGIIAMGMDAQRMVNYTYSGAVEIFALGSKNAPRVPAASIAQYKQIWDTRNLYNYSYLPYDQWDEFGKEHRAPQDDTTEAPIQAAVALMRTSEEAIKASTSTGDASLGNTNPNERSGRALEALQAQSELGNSNYSDNVRRTLIEIADEAVYVIPKITRPGQIVHILGLDDEPDQVMIGQPFEKGSDGVPRPAPPNVTPEIAKLKDNLYKFYDPTQGRYAVTVTIGKATATRQQEGAKALGDLIPHLPPEMAAVVMPDYVKQLSFPGAQGIAERLESVLPPNLQPKKDGAAGAIPPQAQQQIDQLTQQLQQQQQAIQTDQAKYQAQHQIEAMKQQAETDRQRELHEMDNAARIEVARISAAKGAIDPMAAAAEEHLATGLAQAHEVGLTAMEQAHEAQQSALDRQHQAGMAQQQAVQAAAAQQQDQAHQTETQLREQAAAKEQAERVADLPAKE